MEVDFFHNIWSELNKVSPNYYSLKMEVFRVLNALKMYLFIFWGENRKNENAKEDSGSHVPSFPFSSFLTPNARCSAQASTIKMGGGMEH